ncbi:hypothetical protein PBR20603_04203 [Pandoraea bronchicola]|uniref:Uncharacterized protein n=1 Tax=Pandoraea bronchicola TaxID=2508287 RepID=A0A5E5BYM1_9BURK|nr:hypothetical protein PBR20603_04203 [Pandoraea bronchicola]
MARGYRRIFSHPDYNRRLWLRTRSADPAGVTKATVASARGLVTQAAFAAWCHIPPVGTFTPP